MLYIRNSARKIHQKQNKTKQNKTKIRKPHGETNRRAQVMTDTRVNKYAYSRLSSQEVCRLIVSQYELEEPVTCKFYVRGLHDNYLIENANNKFIFRVYRNDWRSREQVLFELELLAFAGDNGAPVASLLRTKSGELAFSMDGAEGAREAALFHYADGVAPGNEISVRECVLLGNTVANIHLITDTFHTSYTRPILDIPYLLDESITAIAPFVDAGALSYLKILQDKIHQAMPPLAKSREIYGICIGDVNPANFHIDHHNRITVFDFDQCGYGYRAFEIGKFVSSLHNPKLKNELSSAFMAGYQQVRPLSGDEIRAIPIFEIISIIWVMAIHVYNVERIGYKFLEQPFWDRRLAIVKELDAAL